MKKNTAKEWHRQCNFKNGNTYTVAWIPERGAKVGKHVRFKDAASDEAKQVLWEVTGVGNTRRTRADLKGREKAKLESIQPRERK